MGAKAKASLKKLLRETYFGNRGGRARWWKTACYGGRHSRWSVRHKPDPLTVQLGKEIGIIHDNNSMLGATWGNLGISTKTSAVMLTAKSHGL